MLRILGNHDLQNVIKEPTRIRETTSTLLDLLVISDTSKVITSGTFDPGLSGHSLIYGIKKLQRNKSAPKYITAKNYKHADINSLKHEFSNAPWSVTEVLDDVDDIA